MNTMNIYEINTRYHSRMKDINTRPGLPGAPSWRRTVKKEDHKSYSRPAGNSSIRKNKASGRL